MPETLMFATDGHRSSACRDGMHLEDKIRMRMGKQIFRHFQRMYGLLQPEEQDAGDTVRLTYKDA